MGEIELSSLEILENIIPVLTSIRLFTDLCNHKQHLDVYRCVSVCIAAGTQ